MTECSALYGTSISTPKDLANIAEDQVKRTEEMKDEEEQHDTLSSGYETVPVLINSLQPWIPAQKIKPVSTLALFGGWAHVAPSLAAELLAADTN